MFYDPNNLLFRSDLIRILCLPKSSKNKSLYMGNSSFHPS